MPTIQRHSTVERRTIPEITAVVQGIHLQNVRVSVGPQVDPESVFDPHNLVVVKGALQTQSRAYVGPRLPPAFAWVPPPPAISRPQCSEPEAEPSHDD